MSQTIMMAKTVQLQDKLIFWSKKCVLQSFNVNEFILPAFRERKLQTVFLLACEKAAKWSIGVEKKAPFFSPRPRSFSPLSNWQPVRTLTGRLFGASFLWTLAKRTGEKQTNKETRQERDALFFHLAPILLFFSSSNTDSVTKRNRLVEPSWLGFE